MQPEGYWFKSPKFEIEPGEDDEINPGIYGRQLERRLKARLEERGYAVEGIINEDRGWCLMCGRDPFMLWVACANLSEDDRVTGEAPLPAPEDIVWHCFAAAEVPFLKSWLRKIETTPALAKLDRGLDEISVQSQRSHSFQSRDHRGVLGQASRFTIHCLTPSDVTRQRSSPAPHGSATRGRS